MGPFVVVGQQPALRQRTDFCQRFKQVGIENLGAVAAVEALDVGVLIGLAGLDVLDRDTSGVASIDEDLGEQLRAVCRHGRPPGGHAAR